MTLVLALLSGRVDAAPPRLLWVYAEGSLPGIGAAKLPSALTDAMRALGLTDWRFVAGTPGAAMAPDRVVWRVRDLPYAGSSLLRIGRLVSRQEDRFGHYRYVSVELKLYLGGAYQATSFATGEIQGGPDDPKLAALVRELAIPLLGIDVTPERPPAMPRPRSK